MSGDRRGEPMWWVFTHVVKPVHLRLREVVSACVDRWLRVRTTDEPVAAALGLDIQEFRRTQRSLGWSGVWRILRHLSLTSGDVFLDIGCGAGRVMCGAARTSTARVVGIDVDPKVLELASTNADTLRGRRAEMVPLCADATTYDVPDDVTVVFLYNPFGGDVLRASIGQLVASLDRSSRVMRVVYANPKEPESLLGTGRFRKSSEISLGWRPGENWKRSQTVHVYTTVPD